MSAPAFATQLRQVDELIDLDSYLRPHKSLCLRILSGCAPILVLGGPGSGKTQCLAYVMQSLPMESFDCLYIGRDQRSGWQSFREGYESCLDRFVLGDRLDSAGERPQQRNRQLVAEKRRLVVMLDDLSSQDLSALGQLPEEKRVQWLGAAVGEGQAVPPADSLTLEGLTYQEASMLLDGMLRRQGRTSPVFAAAAVERLWQSCGYAIKAFLRQAECAMVEAFSRQSSQVDRDCIDRVLMGTVIGEVEDGAHAAVEPFQSSAVHEVPPKNPAEEIESTQQSPRPPAAPVRSQSPSRPLDELFYPLEED